MSDDFMEAAIHAALLDGGVPQQLADRLALTCESERDARRLAKQYRLDPDVVRAIADAAPATETPVTAAGETSSARVVTLSMVTPRRIAWLWDARVPLGGLTTLDGDPGLGKSTLALDIAARVTRGFAMPLSSTTRPPADVILMTAEDLLDATIRPRLDAAGADVARVHAITAMPRAGDADAPATLDPDDVAQLERVIRDKNAAFVIVDPLMAFLPSRIDAHRDQDVRRVLRPLAAVAERTGAAIVIVRHLRKGAGSALYRGGGSIGISGAARSVLLVAADPDDESGRVMASTKANLSQIAPALRWRLVDVDGVARVEWRGIAHGVTANQLAAQPDTSDLDRAVEALRQVLADGPMRADEVTSAVTAEVGCSVPTVKRARSKLGAIATRTSGQDGKVTGWLLSLPAQHPAADPLDVGEPSIGPTSQADRAQPPGDQAPVIPWRANGADPVDEDEGPFCDCCDNRISEGDHVECQARLWMRDVQRKAIEGGVSGALPYARKMCPAITHAQVRAIYESNVMVDEAIAMLGLKARAS